MTSHHKKFKPKSARISLIEAGRISASLLGLKLNSSLALSVSKLWKATVPSQKAALRSLKVLKGRWFRGRPLIQLMGFAEISRTFFNIGNKILMPKHDNEENSVYLASVEPPVSSVKKTLIFPSITGAPSVDTQPIPWISIFMFCKEIFHKLKRIFCCSGCFQFIAEKEVLLYGTIMDIPHQYNELTAIRNIGSLV